MFGFNFIWNGVKYLTGQAVMNKISSFFGNSNPKNINDNQNNMGKYAIAAIGATAALGSALYAVKSKDKPKNVTYTDNNVNNLTTHKIVPESVFVHNQVGMSHKKRQSIAKNAVSQQTLEILNQTTQIISALETLEDVTPLKVPIEHDLAIETPDYCKKVFNYSKSVYFPHQQALCDRIKSLETQDKSGLSGTIKSINQRQIQNLMLEYKQNNNTMGNIMENIKIQYKYKYFDKDKRDPILEQLIKNFYLFQTKLNNMLNTPLDKKTEESEKIKDQGGNECLAICN